MARRFRWVWLMVAAVAILLVPFADNLLAQDTVLAQSSGRGPGGYLSWVKLLMIAAVFLLWVRMADWINRDAMKIGEKTEMAPELWNPLVAFSFLIGFLIAISVPMFVVGFPVYVTAAWLPFMIYFLQRRGKLKSSPAIADMVNRKPGDIPKVEALPQDEGVAVDFTPAGNDSNQRQTNLIRARQTTGYMELKELLRETQFKRSEQVLLDYTRDGVAARLLVDGTWHPLPPMDRTAGDAILTSLKHLSGLNPVERRARQNGRFGFKTDLGKAQLEVTSQGVPTGERVQLKYVRSTQEVMSLSKLGMFPEMVEEIKTSLDVSGLTIITAPAGSGLTSSWQGALTTADRLTRDCVAVIDQEEADTVLENIVIHRYGQSADKTQFQVLKTMLLTQPDFIAVPKLEDQETLDHLIVQANKHDRSIVLQTPAKSAAEGLLRLYAKAGDREEFLAALKHVTCQRLVRRLCGTCKVEVRVQPQVIKQLGGDPNTQGTIYNQWKMPPPDQQVDEQGRPIEFPPCESCGGIGFIGRIAVFEMITVTDQLREFIKKNPKTAVVDKAATKLGKPTIASQAYKLVLLGVTTLAEVQRVLKEQPS